MTASSFDAFFRALWGYAPFPWQTRLATQVLTAGWPSVLGLPTATGKTAALDIGVYALACGGSPGSPQPRRILFVVDRRIVVDETYERARYVAEVLKHATSGVLADVAARLRAVGGGADPLVAALLRGGIYREDRWIRSPAQPTVVVSTVDQVGSRLLHRGYGVSPRTWSIHAGLVGNDSLVVVDEAHCSRPFCQTLIDVGRYRCGEWAPGLALPPFQLVEISATPRGDDGAPRFSLTAADRENPVLRKRLCASKPISLVESIGKGEKGFAATVARQAKSLVGTPRVVAVVVNRVATARRVYRLLVDELDADVILLTGRVRPIVRDALVAAYGSRLRAADERPALDRALVVVATQCIEVGADFDFDALVTECCGLDALMQRGGRVNRLGRAGGPAPIHVVLRAEHAKGSEGDPVYGAALYDTWDWLRSQVTPDLGTDALDALLCANPDGREKTLGRLSGAVRDAPVLLPLHLDCWVQTSPVPHVEPAPSVYLHGLASGPPEVHLVWRGDLPPDDTSWWAEIAGLCLPSSNEALALPIHVVRAWLSKGADEPPMADLEGLALSSKPEVFDETSSRRAVRFGADSTSPVVLTSPAELCPGDTLVLPSAAGGCDQFGWCPDGTAPVPDLGDQAHALRRRTLLRLHPDLVAAWGGPSDDALFQRAQALASITTDDELAEVWPHTLSVFLSELAVAAGAPDWLQAVARQLATDFLRKGRPGRARLHPAGGLVLSSPLRLPAWSSTGDTDVTTPTPARAVTLEDHSAHVRDAVVAIAQALGLPDVVTSDLALSAYLHDWGKADPRFQVYLHGGDTVAAARATALLAKSGTGLRTFGDQVVARARAGYPKGGRHELLSVRLAERGAGLLATAHDRDLVLHLVASHHGYCRPFAPIVPDRASRDVTVEVDGVLATASSATGLERVDSETAARFWRLVRRYGWWGLSWLEAILRLADWQASAEEGERPEE